MTDTPILFIVYKRMDTAMQVLMKIREAQPRHLYIAADGPREGNDDDKVKCELVRKAVLEKIDWECEVRTLFQERNLGCGLNPATAITWFFENVEEGIILEDDCVPEASFFNYCSVLLKKYHDNENIFMISGSNFQNRKYGSGSYFFSEYGHIWGWATWRRAWKNFDYTLTSISLDIMEEKMKNVFSTDEQRAYSMGILKSMKKEFNNDIWDYQWHTAIWSNNAVTITPNKNLVTNVGFNNEGTHTLCEIQGVSNRKTKPLEKIIHPKKIMVQRKADEYLFFKTNLYIYHQPKKRITIRLLLIRTKQYAYKIWVNISTNKTKK